MTVKITGFCTGIGSVPHKDTDFIVDFILDNFKDAPFWPQMAKLGFYENMYVQYSEGLPSVVIDETNEKIYVDFDKPEFNDLVTNFYENFLAGNVAEWKITEKHSKGLYKFLEKVKTPKYLKGQVIGPITYGLKLTDKNGRSVFYDEQYKDVIIKNTLMKAKWMAGEFRKKSPGSGIVIFLDEPYLSSYGSAFIAISREDVISSIQEIVTELRNENVLTGIHCCGNTDWGLVMDTGVDIINLDSYSFADGLYLYPDKLKQFFSEGKRIAWGIVPSSDAINSETAGGLTERLKKVFDGLAVKGIDKKNFSDGLIITSACGLGGLSEPEAQKIIETTREVFDEIVK